MCLLAFVEQAGILQRLLFPLALEADSRATPPPPPPSAARGAKSDADVVEAAREFILSAPAVPLDETHLQLQLDRLRDHAAALLSKQQLAGSNASPALPPPPPPASDVLCSETGITYSARITPASICAVGGRHQKKGHKRGSSLYAKYRGGINVVGTAYGRKELQCH